MTDLATVMGWIAGLGTLQCLAGLFAVWRFSRGGFNAPTSCPPVTILRPLCGDEPMLEEALVSCFSQTYPAFQIVFGIQNPDDPALAVVQRVKERFPGQDVAIVVDSTLHGKNRKVANLINMLPFARHDLLVISDSDLHLQPNYLERLVVEMQKSGTGLVTALYLGLAPAPGNWISRLGATQISHNFLPGVLISRALGRQDSLGSTAMFYRGTLERIGGLHALSHLLAEDNIMGQRVRELGLSIGLAKTVPAATVPEATIPAMWQHEMRWTRTIRALAPLAVGLSAIQYPLFWALIAVCLTGGASWSIALFVGIWLVRTVSSRTIDSLLTPWAGHPVQPTPAWLLPLRDALSVLEIAASYCIDEVTWRGQRMEASSSTRQLSAYSATPLIPDDVRQQS